MEEGGSRMEVVDVVPAALRENVIVTSVDAIFKWARSRSIWPLASGLACCGIEMMATAAARFDLARFGYEVFRACPRQADLLIVAGTLSWKMAPALIRLYEEMPEPKYVIAMGNCNLNGGPFTDTYSTVKCLDEVLPVDIYLPGCPPRPEALIDAMIKLRDKIQHPELAKRVGGEAR